MPDVGATFLDKSSQCAATHGGHSQTRTDEENRAARACALTALVQHGELSHAARVLKSAGLAPGTSDTLSKLRDPTLRPQHLQQPLPDAAAPFVPEDALRLDSGLFRF